MNEKGIRSAKVEVSDEFLRWLIDHLFTDMLEDKLPVEVASFLVKQQFSDLIRPLFSHQKHGKKVERLLESKVPEYRSIALFVARNYPSNEFNIKIRNIFLDESNPAELRIGAIYHLAKNSILTPDEKMKFLQFCDQNKAIVEKSARHYYGKAKIGSDEQMLSAIQDRLFDNNYFNSRFLHLNNLRFIKDKNIRSEVKKLVKNFLNDKDEIIKEVALGITSILK